MSTDIGYLKEFWCVMLRPFISLRVRRKIVQLSKYHLDLEPKVTKSIQDLYSVYGLNMEMLWRDLERCNIISPHSTTGVRKCTTIQVVWTFTMDSDALYIRYFFDCKSRDESWIVEYSTDRSRILPSKRIILRKDLVSGERDNLTLKILGRPSIIDIFATFIQLFDVKSMTSWAAVYPSGWSCVDKIK